MASSRQKSSLSKEAAKGRRFGLVVSRYHEELTQKLLDGALEVLKSHGAADADVHVAWVPGCFEIPLLARALAAQNLDAVICLGIVVKGETPHDEYIASEAAHGIAATALASGLPILFGVLTVLTLEQAKARCGGDQGHKGKEAAEAALQMIDAMETVRKLDSRSGRYVGFGNA